MANDKKVRVAKDKRIKVCGNPDCIVHRNGRVFEPEDIYCTVCQNKLVYACARCGKIFESTGIDDIICDECKAVAAQRQAKRQARRKTIEKHAGTAVKVATATASVVGGPTGRKIAKAVPIAGVVVKKARPAAEAVGDVAKGMKK